MDINDDTVRHGTLKSNSDKTNYNSEFLINRHVKSVFIWHFVLGGVQFKLTKCRIQRIQVLILKF